MMEAAGISVTGLGGIATARNAMEFIVAGAISIQEEDGQLCGPLTTTIRIVEGIEEWPKAHGEEDLNIL